eukprot:1281061-Karenia_brevis.AAC.1
MGREMQSTCFTHSATPSRIDVVICNSMMASALRKVETICDTGIPTHLPVLAEFDLESHRQCIPRIRFPKSLPVEAVKRLSENRHKDGVWQDSCAREVIQRFEARWRDAIQSSDVDLAWQI